jgi:hypothetical protein
MDKILRFIFISLLISPLWGFAQKKPEVWRYEGPRFGLDVSRFLMPFIQNATKGGFEIQADYPYKGNWFPTIEAGYQTVDDNKDAFHYTNKGPYARIGFDVNINKFESLTDNDLVFVGLRYGYSLFAQETLASTYSNYWGTTQNAFPKNFLSAHWGELVFGLKGELIRNFFFGWTVRAKFPIAVTKDPHVKPYVIPGLGYTSSDVPFDFSITVAYRLPLIRTKTIPKPLKTGGRDRRDSDQELDPNDPENNNQNGNNNRGGRISPGSMGGNNSQF